MSARQMITLEEAITEAAFREKWKPLTAPGRDDLLWSAQEVKTAPVQNVWTVHRGHVPGMQVAIPGFVIGGALGYVFTSRPWVSGGEEAVFRTAPTA